MDEYNKEIKRKIAARRLALKCLPDFDAYLEGQTQATTRINRMHRQLTEIQAVLHEINMKYKLFSGEHVSAGGRFRIVRGIRKYVKKAIYLFLRILYYPVVRQQTRFNAFTVQSLNQMNAIVESMVEIYGDIYEGTAASQAQGEEAGMENLAIISECKKISSLVKENEEMKAQIKYLMEQMSITCDLSLLENSRRDYFAFENKFRGPRDGVKASQAGYIDYFRQNGGMPILDIGCGRGEFLELLYDVGISAHGIDCYTPFIDYCKSRGFTAEEADALTYLTEQPDSSIGGIFMAHVAEHLANDYLIALIRTAYCKLKPGCYFILETPNPECLAAMTEFNIDISHKKPLHFQSLKDLFLSANFTDVTRYDNEPTKWPVQLEKVQDNDVSDHIINSNTDMLNSILFGYRDYTLIARK